jgi:hypothetical protein
MEHPVVCPSCSGGAEYSRERTLSELRTFVNVAKDYLATHGDVELGNSLFVLGQLQGFLHAQTYDKNYALFDLQCNYSAVIHQRITDLEG